MPVRRQEGRKRGRPARPAQRGELHLQQRSPSDGLERRDRAGDESRLLLKHGVVDRGAKAFVEDLDAEQLGGGGGAVFVGRGQGDIKGQDLVAGSLKPWTSDSGISSSWSVVALTGTATSRVRVELKTPV